MAPRKCAPPAVTMDWMARSGPPARRDPDPCPSCGHPLSLDGRFCKGCGWDADLAESEDSSLDDVGVPQGYGKEDPEDFDYDRVVEGEGLRPTGAGWVVAAVSAVLLALALVVILNAR